jgi:hypothetical protein
MRFVVADRFVVRGLSVRNRQPGLGTPLVAVTREDLVTPACRAGYTATVLLRLEGGLQELAQGRLRALARVCTRSSMKRRL